MIKTKSKTDQPKKFTLRELVRTSDLRHVTGGGETESDKHIFVNR